MLLLKLSASELEIAPKGPSGTALIEQKDAKDFTTAQVLLQGNALEASESALEAAREGTGTSSTSHKLAAEIQSSAEEIRFRSLLASGSDEDAATASQDVDPSKLLSLHKAQSKSF